MTDSLNDSLPLPSASSSHRQNRWKQRLRKIAISLAMALMIAFSIKAAVADLYVVRTTGVSPEVPEGTRVLVYKLSPEYAVGQIVAFQDGDLVKLARVTQITEQTLTVDRNDAPPQELPLDRLIGRVIVGTR